MAGQVECDDSKFSTHYEGPPVRPCHHEYVAINFESGDLVPLQGFVPIREIDEITTESLAPKPT
jgi:hypothetical protein